MANSAGKLTVRRAAAAVLAVTFVVGCSNSVGGSAEVSGVGAEDFLRLRAGPGLSYNVILGLPDGTTVMRRGCVTEASQLWCRIALAHAPGITGYVSADYLSVPRT